MKVEDRQDYLKATFLPRFLLLRDAIIHDMQSEGLSARSIAEILKKHFVVSHETVRKIIGNKGRTKLEE